MKNEDAQLVHRFLSGDESAFTTLVKKHQKSIHAARMAEGWRFPHRRGTHTGCLPQGIPETWNAEESEPVRWMALRDRR